MAEMPDFDRLEVAVKDICDEYQRLKAIVDRLPKTADGVPICPGDTVFHIPTYAKHVFERVNFRWHVEAFPRRTFIRAHWGEDGFDADIKWVDLFSTRAAAEAFLEGGE